jgi:hypothetical protein
MLPGKSSHFQRLAAGSSLAPPRHIMLVRRSKTAPLGILVLASLLAGCGGAEQAATATSDGGGGRDETRTDGAATKADTGHTGTPVDAGRRAADSASASPCGDAGIAFELQYDGSLCLGSVCGEDWLSIADEHDAAVPFVADFLQCSDCAQCAQQPDSCYLACPIVPPSPGPESFEWNGQVYASSTCSTGQGCTTASCAAPGTYTATMCVHPPGGDGGSDGCFVSPKPAPTCKTISFQWPPSQPGATVAWSP